MIGLLLKLIIVCGVVIGGFSYLSNKNPHLITDLATAKTKIQSGNFSQLADIDTNLVKNNLSASLDSLVTHPDKNSPVVLGVKVTNDSLNTLVDVIRQLPPEQVEQLKDVVCSPATPSAKP